MRTTLNIDDALLAKAGEYTGQREKTALVRMGLEALIQREAARRLADLGGAMPKLKLALRRKNGGEPREMILADTSVWVQHFRRGLAEFATALRDGQISIHPVVLGELATGTLAKRTQTLADLRTLPRVKDGTLEECLSFIESHRLYGRGIGWNDLQLLVAARLSALPLWTLDTRVNTAANEMGVAYTAP